MITYLLLMSCVGGSFFLPAGDAAQVKLRMVGKRRTCADPVPFGTHIVIELQPLSYMSAAKGFIQCKQKDPKFNKCALGAVQASIPQLAKGQPKFGLPPIDPLRIESLYIDQGQGSVVVKLNFSNLDILGLGKSVMESVQVEPQIPRIQLRMRTNQPLILNGTYVVNGKVLVLPISGNGHSKLVLDGFTGISALTFRPVDKNGDVYWSLEKTDFNFNTTRLHINLENLFNGNKELGDNMNTFLNENWQLLLDELRPAFRNALTTIYSSYVQRFFDRVPAARIFPPQ